jgi:hypothetical protein
MSTSEWVYAVVNEWIIVGTDGRVVTLSYTHICTVWRRKLRWNKQRQNGQYVVPNGIDPKHVQLSGYFVTIAVNVLKELTQPFPTGDINEDFSPFHYFRRKSVHETSQPLLAQLTDIHESWSERNACEDRPIGV